MEYMSIKELAKHFAIPDRTVYYTVSNNLSIRQQKQGRRKIVNVADFAKACGKELPWVASSAPLPQKNSNPWNDFAELQTTLQSLQEEKRVDNEKIFALQQTNTDLKADRDSFIQRYENEKDEKERLRWQYAIVQQNHHEEIKRYLKKYYITLGICVVSVLLLLAVTITPLLWSVGILNS